MYISKIQGINQISFKGHKAEKSEDGKYYNKFYLPYDQNKYKDGITVEFAKVFFDGKYWHVDPNQRDWASAVIKGNDEISLDTSELFVGHKDIAYRFKVGDKYVTDPGVKADAKHISDDTQFTVLFDKKTNVGKHGAMTLIVPDAFNPGYRINSDGKVIETTSADLEYKFNNKDRARSALRTHSNLMGGNFAGVIEKLDELKGAGVRRIVSTPFTKDDISSHKYWTKNGFQIAKSLGGYRGFKLMQEKLFEKGMNWVADGAFVNEGIEGDHFRNVLRYGQDSPFFHWFKISGMENNPLELGVFPSRTDRVGFKLVNPEYYFAKDTTGDTEHPYLKTNDNYDPKKPTYIQVFDKSLASQEQQEDINSLIEVYEKTNYSNEENPYDINTHDDTVYPYSFEVKNPKEIYNKIADMAVNATFDDLYSFDNAVKLLKFENYEVKEKKVGGFVIWDGNVDIAKLNFYQSQNEVESSYDTDPENAYVNQKNKEEAISMVKDHTVEAGKYLTKITKLISVAHGAELMGEMPSDATAKDYVDKITANSSLFPSIDKKELQKVAENVLNGSYELKLNQNGYDAKNTVTKELMNLPLESFECGSDLAGVLGSPFVSKKTVNEDFIGKDRFDLFFNDMQEDAIGDKYLSTYDRMNKVYQNEFTRFALEVLLQTKTNEKIVEDTKLTPFGNYVAKLYMPEIFRYALTKALKRDAEITRYQDGEINYEKAGNQDITLKSLGVNALTPKEEAEQVIGKIRKGLDALCNSPEDIEFLAKYLEDKTKKLNANTFKMSEAIVDRAELGLCWRIDAAKDICSIDDYKNDAERFEDIQEKMTDFWSKFQDGVKSENEHSYMTAEVTDLHGFFPNMSEDDKNENVFNVMRNFISQTGLNSIANYNFYFSSIPSIYGTSFEKGNAEDSNDRGKTDNLIVNFNKFLRHAPLEGLINSYTFLGNHDKPRVLHCLSLDMGLFHSNFIDKSAHNEFRYKAVGVYALTPECTDASTIHDVSEFVRDKYSSKAVAMGARLKEAFVDVLNSKDNDGNLKFNQIEPKYVYEAIRDMVSGKYKDQQFDAEAFGVKPIEKNIDFVLEYALQKQEAANPKIEKAKEDENATKTKQAKLKDLKESVYLSIIEPAMGKYLSMFKILTTLPGTPTDYAGDNLGMTGYETPSKNDWMQNRNAVNWDILGDDGIAAKNIGSFNAKAKDIQRLRKDSRLSALNDGSISKVFVDDNENNKKFFGLLRYNDKGSIVVSLTNIEGVAELGVNDVKRPVQKVPVSTPRIVIGIEGNNETLQSGLSLGTYFKNQRTEDPSVYGVTIEENGQYCLRCFDTLEHYNEYVDFRKANKQYDLQGGMAGNSHYINIYPEDLNTLVLYRADNKVGTSSPSFKGLRNYTKASVASLYQQQAQKNQAKLLLNV